MRRFGNLTVRLVLGAILLWYGADCASADAYDGPAYRDYLLEHLEPLLARHFADADAFLQDDRHLHVAALAAACEVRAWQWTGERRFADAALARLRQIAAKQGKIRASEFFMPLPLSVAYQHLAQAGLVDQELQRAMRQFVAIHFVPTDDDALHNQTLTRACGLEIAAQVWPDLPEAVAWHDYALKIYALLARCEDVPENSPNYNNLDLVCTFLLADLLEKPELLVRPGIRAMVLRYRDQVSPAGFLAPYGDAGNAPRPFDPAWPMESPWAHYVAAFERGARQWQDPTLRWAATRVMQCGRRWMPLGRYYTEVEDLFYMGFVVDWVDPQLAPKMPKLASQILTRRDTESDRAWDKLILASSRASGAPFVMCDLYARGFHGHVNQHGGLTYFEYDNAPLLTILGYNNRDPEHTNLVLMRDAEDPFPHVPEVFVPGVWHEASLPTKRLPLVDPEQPHLRKIDSITLRVGVGRRGVTFWADDLRLTGPGRPPIVLDDFESPQGWHGDPQLSDDAPHEGHSLVWDLPPGVQFRDKEGFDRTFDVRQYPQLKLRWKLSNNDERSRPLIVRAGVDYHAHAIQLEPELVDVQVEQRGDDQFGSMTFHGWFTPGTTLCRQLVLTRSGVLIVRDVLTPGPSAAGSSKAIMVGGPIWHLGPTTPPEAGAHWFNSAGGPQSLLVAFSQAPGRSFGSQTVDVWSKRNQQTVYAKQALAPDEPICFVTVLVPHQQHDAAALAEKIQIAGDLDRSRIQVDLPRDRFEVQIESTGPWSIARH